MNLAARLAADPLLAQLLQLALFASLTAGVFVLLLRRCRAPAFCHALARTGLWVLLLLPFSVALAHRSGAGLPLLPAAAPAGIAVAPMQHEAQNEAPATKQTRLTDPARPVPADPVAQSAAAPVATAPLQAAPLPAGLLLLLSWTSLSAPLLLRQLRRWWRLRAVVVTAPAVADAQLLDEVAALAASLRLRRPPRLAAIASLPCPATFGLLRPTLLLPPALFADGDAATRTTILRHELAHLGLGHHREAVLQLAARCLFGWLPWAHALARELGQAQEQVADNVALAGAASPTAYARTLLALAERATTTPPPTPLLLGSLGDHELRDRITRLLSGDLDMNHRPSRRGRLAAAALLCASAAPFPFRLLPAQGPAAETPTANSGVHYLPLGEGTTWTWHVTRKDADGASERDETSRVWGTVPAGDGKPVAQVQTRRDGYVSWDYLAARNDGVFTYHNAYLGGLRGVTDVDERLLPAPVGATTQWEWDEQLSYQIMGDAPEPDPETTRVHHLAKLLAIDEVVAVPAGTYKAVHVRIAATGANVSTRDLWFARGVGIVKDEHHNQDAHQLRELTAFAPGAKSTFDAEATLQAYRQATPLHADAAIEWMPVGDEACYVRGRFAILRQGDTATCAHVTQDGVVTFAPDDKAFWSKLLAALAAERSEPQAAGRHGGTTDAMQLTWFARLAARLHALVLHCTELRMAGRTSMGGQAAGTMICQVIYAAQSDGIPVQIATTMTVAGSTVTELDFLLQSISPKVK